MRIINKQTKNDEFEPRLGANGYARAAAARRPGYVVGLHAARVASDG